MKRIKNNDSISHTWAGQLITAGSYYTLQPTEYANWSMDAEVLSAIGSGIGIMNDGSNDLGVSAGIDLLKDFYTKPISSNISYQGSTTNSTKTETDLTLSPAGPYTVGTGKVFSLTHFFASYDSQTPMYVRFKKDTGGIGVWTTLFTLPLSIGASGGQSAVPLAFATPLKLGVAGDKFKITYEGTLPRGIISANFSGVES